MLEVILSMILIFTVFNFIMLYRLMGKRQQLPSADTIALYEEQIKHLKKISRLNERYIKTIREKEEQNNEKMAENKQQEDMVQTVRRVY